MKNIKTILIADDDKFMLLALKTVLEKENYIVTETSDGIEAVSEFKKNTPDCVLLDGLMPNLDGFNACNKIRELPNGKAVPIFIVSGLSKDKIKKDYPNIKATGFMPKPIDWLKMVKRLAIL